MFKCTRKIIRFSANSVIFIKKKEKKEKPTRSVANHRSRRGSSHSNPMRYLVDKTQESATIKSSAHLCAKRNLSPFLQVSTSANRAQKKKTKTSPPRNNDIFYRKARYNRVGYGFFFLRHFIRIYYYFV